MLDKVFGLIGRKFLNLVFKKRWGKKEWSARTIFFIMNFFDRFEVYINTKQTGRFDHYIPQFLLRQWKISESGPDKGRIFSWSKNTDSIGRVTIKGMGGAINWDVSNSQGIPSDYISKKLFAELLEAKTPYVLKLINDNSYIKLTFLEESTLSVFIAHQITRVPAFRELLLHFFSIGYSRGLIEKGDFGDRDMLVKKVALNQIGLTFNQFIEGSAPKSVDGGKPQIILLSIIIASNIAEKIYKGNLHILEIPDSSSDEFVISDNPVIFFDFGRGTLPFVPWWEIGNRDFLIFMPISPKKAIFYSKSKRKDGQVENNSEDLVNLINSGQYILSSNTVFARNKEIIKRHLQLLKVPV